MNHTEITKNKLEYYTSQLAIKIGGKYYNKTEVDEKISQIDLEVPTIEYDEWVTKSEAEKEALGFVEITNYPSSGGGSVPDNVVLYGDDVGDTYQIDTLNNNENTIIYPKTRTDAVYDSDGNRLDSTITQMSQDLSAIWSIVYPVGSIYMTVNNVSPSTLFGGTWEAWGSGRVPVGVDTNDKNFNEVEKTGGASTHTLTEAEMPQHKHNVSVTSSGTCSITSSGAHTHTVPNHSHTMQNAGNHSHTVPYLHWVQNSTGSTKYGFMSDGSKHDSTNEAGSHSHTINSSGSCTITSSGAHTHTVPNHSHTISESNKGSDNAHNNLQPYITCYMWKRTA